MDPETFAADKRALRGSVRAAIAQMSPEERHRRSDSAQARFAAMPQFIASRTVLFYHALPGEVDTGALIAQSLLSGKRVALPRTDPGTSTMQAVQIRNLATDLIPGPCAAQEPRDGLPVIAAADIDLVVVPGRAFDACGHRLGRGAGYYDRYLASLRGIRAALAFDCQILASVPSGPHDIAAHLIVTESRIVLCGNHGET